MTTPTAAQSADQSAASDAAAALAAFLIARDWPSASPRERHVRHAYEYGVMAAAIINGEAWAIRKAWPLAAGDIEDSRHA